MAPSLSSYPEYRYVCIKCGLIAFDTAIENKQLPSRFEHSWILIKTLGICPFSVCSRAAACAYVTINNFIHLVIPTQFDLKKYLLIEIKNEYIHMVSCIAIQVLRLSSSVWGIVSSSSHAVQGWKMADRIDYYCWRQKAILAKQMGDIQIRQRNAFKASPQKQPIFLPLRMFSLHLYLGPHRFKEVTQSKDGWDANDEPCLSFYSPADKPIYILSGLRTYQQEVFIW